MVARIFEQFFERIVGIELGIGFANSAFQAFDALVIGHTASHQYYQISHWLKTIRASQPGMWLEPYRLRQFVTDSTVGFDSSTEAKIEIIQLLELMNQVQKSLYPRK